MIGDKIILYRKRKGLTQEELADLLEVSRQTVTKWESEMCIRDRDSFNGCSCNRFISYCRKLHDFCITKI